MTTRTSPPSRLWAALAALLTACSTVVVAAAPTSAAPEPVAATTTVYGKGAMDTSEVVLSPTEPTGPRPGDAPGAGAAGWSTTVDLLPGTQMVAVTWDADRSVDEGVVAVRGRSAGSWAEWTVIRPDLADMGEVSTRVGSDVIWLGEAGADAVEIRVDVGPLAGLELMRMRYHPGEPEVVETPQARTAGRAAAKPPIRARSAWATRGWRTDFKDCSRGPTAAPTLKHAVVHHTAGTNTYSAAMVPGLLRSIYALHTSYGWCDVGYNFFVDRFGVIWQGRSGDMDKPINGGHAKWFNTGSVGVALMGQFEPGEPGVPPAAQPSTAMMDSTARLLAWKLSLHGLDPTGTASVFGGGPGTRYPTAQTVRLPVINAHIDTGRTACPGAYVIARLPALRAAVKASMGSPSTPPPPPPPPTPPPGRDWAPFASVEDLVWRQFADFRGDPGSYSERRWWNVNLANGSTNRNALVAALARSPHVDDRAAAVVRLYLVYFRRVPDHAGIRFWFDQMARGMSLRTMSARFAGTPEFRTLYGPVSDAEFVRLAYRNVLERSPSAADMSFWVGRIRSGQESRGGVMALFSKSAEFETRSQTVMEVILIHEVMLGRALSPQAHLQWVARVDADGIGALIGNLFSSAEYATRVRR